MNPGDLGVDVSNYQTNVDYAAVKGSGRTFAYILVSDGTNFENSEAQHQAKGFQGVGMETGGYLFWRPDQSFDKQISNFTKYYEAIGGWTLPIMIDCETESANGWAWTASQLGLLRANLITATHAQVGIYVNLNFYDNMAGCPWGWDLWLADPSHATPSKPCLLQQSGTGTVPGISGQVDLDTWRGGSTPVPVPPVVQGEDMIAPTPTGDGYWLCSSSGAIVTRGDAQYLGGPNTSQVDGQWTGPAALPVGQTCISIAAHPTLQGYWIESSGGNVYAYGSAGWHGNTS